MNQLGPVQPGQATTKESGMEKRPGEKPSEWAKRIMEECK